MCPMFSAVAAIFAVMILGITAEQARWPAGTTSIGSSEITPGSGVGRTDITYLAMNAIGV